MEVKITVGDKEYIIGKEYEFSDMLQEDKNFEVKWRKGIFSGYCPHPNSANSFVCGNQYYVHCREKVEEFDYEILDYRDYNGDLFKYLHNGCAINSVKRLSDGEVFTIGDRVHQVSPLKDDNTWLIKEFSTKDTRCFTIGVNITCIEKSKTPLFTTEDGFEIFEDDNFFYINTHVWVVAKTNANMPMIHHVIEVNKYKTFSSEEKAEEYVLINKPMLSLQDLLNVWGVSDEIGAYKTSLMFNKFEKLAKSKL